MSTAASAPSAPSAPVPGDCLTETAPTVPTRRSIFPKGACPAPTATIPAVSLPATSFADWRRRAVTEELEAVTALRVSRPARGTTLRRHLRSALVGTLLAVVAVSGLSAYAAQGVAEARPTAPCQAHISCK